MLSRRRFLESAFVAAIAASLGAAIVDADALAREAVAPGSSGLNAVVRRFGGTVLRPDGEWGAFR